MRFTSRFEIDDTTRVVVVSLGGKLDPIGVEDLHPQVQELVRAGFKRFVFDLSALDYVGSLGLRLFVGLHNQVKGEGAVALCDPKAGVASVLDLTKVGQVLRTFPTRADAVDAVRSA
jgi:anti-anti-sigma factor